MATRGLIAFSVFLAVASVFALDSVRTELTARIGADSIVRVASDNGTAEYAKVAFELPVAADAGRCRCARDAFRRFPSRGAFASDRRSAGLVRNLHSAALAYR